MSVFATSRASACIQDISATLRAMVYAGDNEGDPDRTFFSTVGTFDTVDSFLEIGGRFLAAKGPAPAGGTGAVGGQGLACAGVVPGDVIRGRSQASGEAYQERIPVEVLYTFAIKRLPGKDELDAVATMLDYAEEIRKALLLDLSRGGAAGLTNFDGQYVNGTAVDGSAKMVDTAPDQAIYTAAISLVCGWTVPD